MYSRCTAGLSVLAPVEQGPVAHGFGQDGQKQSKVVRSSLSIHQRDVGRPSCKDRSSIRALIAVSSPDLVRGLGCVLARQRVRRRTRGLLILLVSVASVPVGVQWPGTAHPGPMGQGITVPSAIEQPLHGWLRRCRTAGAVRHLHTRPVPCRKVRYRTGLGLDQYLTYGTVLDSASASVPPVLRTLLDR